MWPPPSAPWAMTPWTPHSATFSAWRRAPTVGMTTSPPPGSGPPGRVGRLGEAGHLHPGLDQQRDPVADVGRVGAQVDPERGRRCGSHLGDGRCQLVQGHGGRGQDAEAAGVGRGRHQPGAGHPAHARLHDRVAHPDQVAERGAQGRVGRRRLRRRAPLSSAPPCRAARGVEHLADQLELLGRGQAGLGHVVGDDEREAGGRHDLVDGRRPGWTERRRMAWSGVSKSKTPRLETTRRTSWKRVAAGPAAAARS